MWSTVNGSVLVSLRSDSFRSNPSQLGSTAVNPGQSKSTGQDRSTSQRVRVNTSVRTVRSDDSVRLTRSNMVNSVSRLGQLS
ncbi:hypothetical protein Hanom_Chr09g00841261 [Helianthus anomalus]